MRARSTFLPRGRYACAVFAVARCSSVRLSVRLTCWWIVSTRLKISSNFFISPIAPSFYFSDPQRRNPIPRETPWAVAQSTREWENFAIFDWNRRLSRKRQQIGPCLLWNVNRKSYVLYRMVTFSMTLTDPKPSFQGHGMFEVEHLKNVLETRLL